MVETPIGGLYLHSPLTAPHSPIITQSHAAPTDRDADQETYDLDPRSGRQGQHRCYLVSQLWYFITNFINCPMVFMHCIVLWDVSPLWRCFVFQWKIKS